MTQIGNNNDWFVATVKEIIEETSNVKSFRFEAPHPLTHQAGQHYELRLTAENGYQAARLYSAATPGTGTKVLELTIMDVPDGEVSLFVTTELQEGDEVEIRGPFGKFFVWTAEETRPVLLIGGGGGVVPMHAILSSHQQSGSTSPMKLLYSTRHFDDIIYRDEFIASADVTITLTKEAPAHWMGLTGRINEQMIKTIIEGLDSPLCYICGMSPFVDAASDALVALNIPAADIKTERFG